MQGTPDRTRAGSKHAQSLFDHGFVVCKLLPEEHTAQSLQREFQATVAAMPEFTPAVRRGENPTTLGGFAALSNPSSFHNPFAKKYRTDIYQAARTHIMAPFIQLFQHSAGVGTPYAKQFQNKTLTAETEWSTQVLLGRMMHRRAGQCPTAESWHRDIVPVKMKNNEASGAQPNDLILGGWTNFTDHDQTFSCLPGSHFFKVGDIRPARLTEIGQHGFDRVKKKSELAFCTQHRRQIAIPPLHTILFFQHLLHEVHARATTHDQYRLSHGFRMTPANTLLFETQYRQWRTFEDHGPALLPSGQSPRMYSHNHGSAFLGLFMPAEWKCKEWYEAFRREHPDEPPEKALEHTQLQYEIDLAANAANAKTRQKAKPSTRSFARTAIAAFAASGYPEGTLRQFQTQPQWNQAEFNSNPDCKRLKPKFRVLGRKDEPPTNLVYWSQATFSPPVQATFETKTQKGTGMRYRILPPVMPSLVALGLPKATGPKGRALYHEKEPFELQLHPLVASQAEQTTDGEGRKRGQRRKRE
jgi:hypothetical protein